MAKGASFFSGIVNKGKKYTSKIKSNLKTNIDDQIKSAATRRMNRRSVERADKISGIMDNLREVADEADVMSALSDVDIPLKEGISRKKLQHKFEKSVLDSDFKPGSIDWGEFVDKGNASRMDDAVMSGKVKMKSTEAGENTMKQYKDLKNEALADNEALKRIKNDRFIGDEQNRLEKNKKKEYERIVKEKIKSGTPYDKRTIMQELDDSGDYKIANPYDDIRKENESARRTIEREQRSARKKASKELTGDDLDSSLKDIDSKAEKELDNLDKMYQKKSDKIYNETGYRDGTRKKAFEDYVGAGQANLDMAEDYYFHSPTSTKQKAIRIGTTAAAIGGTALGARYLTGGNLRYNADGEKDIAGIPFI